MENSAATLENSLAVPQKVKHRVTIWPTKSTYITKRIENIYPHKNLFIAALFIIAKSRNNPNVHKWWMNKTCRIHTMEYRTIKRNETLIHTTTWMNLENIMVSEGSQTQKTTYRIPFIENVQNRQIHRDRKQISDCRGWREGGMGEWLIMSMGFLLGVKMF